MNKDWKKEEIESIYNMPLIELIHKASEVHRKHHNPREVQVSTLISIKTGGCPEDCNYCPQAARYSTGVNAEKMMTVEMVKDKAIQAKNNGSSRVCMGAAWRNVKQGKDFENVLEMVRQINKLDMEVCCTLGMITETQAKQLAEAGLYAYNHNLDTSEEHYKKVISTRGYDDRLKTIENVRKTNITVCSGGIIGMGEKAEDRIQMLLTFSKLNPHPESLPINTLVAVEGTPLENQEKVSVWDLVRMIATARIVLPNTVLRLSAGRHELSQEGQALCFLVGAGSIFSGEKLLTTPNAEEDQDKQLFEILGIQPLKPFKKKTQPQTIEKENSKYQNIQNENVKWSRPKTQSRTV